MLDTVFLRILDMTRTGSVVILAVLLARLLLKRAPKVYSYALWAIVLFRLICPVTLEAPVSLLPEAEPVSQSYELSQEPISAAGAGVAAYRLVGDAINGGLGVQHVATTQRDALGNIRYITTDWWNVMLLFGQYLWLAGLLGMLLYGMISYWKLQRRLRTAILLRQNIYLAEGIGSPFVIGFFRPRIYLPEGLGEKEQTYILLHEQAHIRRGDPLLKVLAWFSLCLHWFNPLVWLAFTLACRDMEMSCDEAVLKKLGGEIRAEYAASLLSLATGRRIIAGAPLAFGEGDPKGRIKNLAKWKKPALWVILAAGIGCVILGICLITDPASEEKGLLMGANYSVDRTLYDVTEGEGERFDRITVTADYQLYRQKSGADYWISGRDMESYPLTEKELKQYTGADSGWKENYRIGKISDAYIVRMENGYFYLVFCTGRGDTLFGFGWEDVSERNQPGSDDTNLRWLCRLEPEPFEGEAVADFIARSLYAPVGLTQSIGIWEAEKNPGYLVAGFLADPHSPEEFHDMGYAVFQRSGAGCRLLRYHVYDEAALAENGIFFCNHPAVLSLDGTATDENSFDVILSVNPSLSKISREYYKEDTLIHAVTAQPFGAPSMSLFAWDECPEANRVRQYYLAADGTVIEDTGALLTEERLAEGVYIPTECLYMNPLSSYFPHNISKDFQYTVTEDGFVTRGILLQDGIDILSVNWHWQTLQEAGAALDFLQETGHYETLVKEDCLYQELDATRCILQSGGRLYLIQHRDSLWYIFALEPETAAQKQRLTLADVLDLSQLGENLTWEDLAGFEYEDVGSGLYICRYPIDEAYTLQVTDGKRSGSPMQAVLVSNCTGVSRDIRTGNIKSFITSESVNARTVMIEAVIAGQNAKDMPDGLVFTSSHLVLGEETALATPLLGSGHRATRETVYLLVMQQRYRIASNVPQAVSGSCGAVAITFDVDEAGQYRLSEYWEPREGSYYSKDIRTRFPENAAEMALDDQQYLDKLESDCYKKACTYITPTNSLRERIGILFAEVSASPAQYSMPGPYIEAHPEQWQELISYGSSTLEYCFSEFTVSGQKGLLELLMALACEEILKGMGEEGFPAVEGHGTGSQWFNHFGEYAQLLMQTEEKENVEKYHPGAWLYLHIRGWV